jgi:hypothetical protein
MTVIAVTVISFTPVFIDGGNQSTSRKSHFRHVIDEKLLKLNTGVKLMTVTAITVIPRWQT